MKDLPSGYVSTSCLSTLTCTSLCILTDSKSNWVVMWLRNMQNRRSPDNMNHIVIRPLIHRSILKLYWHSLHPSNLQQKGVLQPQGLATHLWLLSTGVHMWRSSSGDLFIRLHIVLYDRKLIFELFFFYWLTYCICLINYYKSCTLWCYTRLFLYLYNNHSYYGGKLV